MDVKVCEIIVKHLFNQKLFSFHSFKGAICKNETFLEFKTYNKGYKLSIISITVNCCCVFSVVMLTLVDIAVKHVTSLKQHTSSNCFTFFC